MTTTEVTLTDAQEAPQVAAVQDTLKNRLKSRYGRFCDWVSEAMGRPLNITFWFVAIIAWTFIFAFGSPHLASGAWLPAWFTSTGYNFPLNLVTTVCELFIGFLVGTASNRSQNALTALLNHMQAMLAGIKANGEGLSAQANQLSAQGNQLSAQGNQLSAQGKQLSTQGDQLAAQGNQIQEVQTALKTAIDENTELTRRVHTLTVQVSKETASLEGLQTQMSEVFAHVMALTRQAGLQVGKPDRA